MKDVKDFVRAAGDCDFDIDVKYNRTIIDAKSLLGMIGLGLQNDLQVCYGGKNENFENLVDKFSLAQSKKINEIEQMNIEEILF